MLTAEAMLSLAAELTGAAADGDAESLAAIAWRLYGETGENLAEIGRLRAAVHAAWNRPQEPPSPAPAAACSGTTGTAPGGGTAMRRVTAKPGCTRGWPVEQFEVTVTGQGPAASRLLAGQPPTRAQARRPATPGRAVPRSTAGPPPRARCPGEQRSDD